MEFSRQEYKSELPFLFLGDLPSSGIKPMSLVSLTLQADSLLLVTPGKPMRRHLDPHKEEGQETIETPIGEMQLLSAKHQGNSATPEARGETWDNCFLIRVSGRNHDFPSGSGVKNPPANAGDPGSVPGSERSPGRANCNPRQYSCLENPMDRGAWQAIVHGVICVGHD